MPALSSACRTCDPPLQDEEEERRRRRRGRRRRRRRRRRGEMMTGKDERKRVMLMMTRPERSDGGRQAKHNTSAVVFHSVWVPLHHEMVHSTVWSRYLLVFVDQVSGRGPDSAESCFCDMWPNGKSKTRY